MTTLITIKSDFDRFHEWQQAFESHGIEAIPWEQRHQRIEEIHYALVWNPEPGTLAAMPALEVIFSVGAGIDHLKGDNLVPPGIPVVRMVEDSLTAGMVEFVVYNVLRFHREMAFFENNQRKHAWIQRTQQSARTRTVGILGLGVLGAAAATLLRQLEFNVIGWSRTEKQLQGVNSYFGSDQLSAFLAKSEFLVCLLPLTNATQEMVNRTVFSQLPTGAFFINAGRGPVVNESDLIAALDSGQLQGAALDVFHQEPLSPDSPFWSHDKVVITPHVASITLPPTSAEHVANNINRHLEAKPLLHLADLSRGY